MGKIKLTFKFVIGKSEGGYYHIPLLSIGIGKNGFGVYLLGFYIGVAILNEVK